MVAFLPSMANGRQLSFSCVSGTKVVFTVSSEVARGGSADVVPTGPAIVHIADRDEPLWLKSPRSKVTESVPDIVVLLGAN